MTHPAPKYEAALAREAALNEAYQALVARVRVLHLCMPWVRLEGAFSVLEVRDAE